MKTKYIFLLPIIILFSSCSSEQGIMDEEETRIMKDGSTKIVDYKQSTRTGSLEMFADLLAHLRRYQLLDNYHLSIQIFTLNGEYIALIKTRDARIIFRKESELAEWETEHVAIFSLDPIW